MSLFQQVGRLAAKLGMRQSAGRASRWRQCRIEQMESRQLLSATVPAIHLGATYYEDASDDDGLEADSIYVSFVGGAAGTQLSQLVIDTDKDGDGLTPGDAFFDTQAGGLGVGGWSNLQIVSAEGFQVTGYEVADGGTQLILHFEGFDAGEKLVLSIDCDERQSLKLYNAVVEGAEFEGSTLTGTFTHANYYDAEGFGVFADQFDFGDSGLTLPDDSFVPPHDTPRYVYTAGAMDTFTQTPLPITIAGTVYEDRDRDNQRDAGEAGIGGVQLSLWELIDGNYVDTGRTTTTDGNGAYSFADIAPGTYRVVETQPSGYFSVGAQAGKVDGVTRGSVVGVDIVSEITLLGGDDSTGNDFGEVRPATLSGHVYHDANNNGVRDAGEVGIGGALIEIYYLPTSGPAPAPIQVYTDAAGFWSAGSLMPGSYRVVESQPAGYLDGLDAAGTAGGTAVNPGDAMNGIVLASGQAGENYDFGELRPGSISGRVHVEYDLDCVLDPGEPVLSGVTIQLLDHSGNVIGSTATDAEGRYRFDGLAPGVYGVRELQPAGYLDGKDHVGTAGGTLAETDAILTIVIGSDVDGENYDFCEVPPASLSGYVYVDINQNGVKDSGEAVLGGVTLALLDSNGAATGRTTVTDANGFYRFDNLRPGTYGVAETQPSGYFDGLDTPGSAGGAAQNPGDRITQAVIGAGVDAVEYNFGEVPPASLSGYVYVDVNQNGVKDAGEAGIAGVKLSLLDANGAATGRTVLTDVNGYYRFDNLMPGAYGVAETQPSGYFDGLDAPGSAGGAAENPGDRITQALLAPGTDATEYNFGEVRPASVRGRIHAELDMDCIRDANEPWLAGVTVYLLDAAGNRIASTTTNKDGEYSFTNLTPGIYGVEEVQPADYLDGTDHVGTAGGSVTANDRITGIQLGSGVDGFNYDFCELTPASISGYVFQDGPVIKYKSGQAVPDVTLLRDGIFNAGDKPLAGVVLQLADASGAPLLDAKGQPITAVTNADGYYEFRMLYPGVYTVYETGPAGYIDGIDTPGSLGGLAVNLHSLIDSGIISALAVDPKNDAILQISLMPGNHATNYNFSEVVAQAVPPENPDPPVWPDPPRGVPQGPAPVAPGPLVSPMQVALLFPITTPPFVGGGGGPGGTTWHLSVINGGQPRRIDGGEPIDGYSDYDLFNPDTWTGPAMDRSQWTIADSSGHVMRTLVFGPGEGLPLMGDFNGDGKADLAVFVDGHWFIDLNGDGAWTEGDLWARLGGKGDLPVAGDWDGDGKADIGIFGPAWLGDVRALASEPGLPDVKNRATTRPKNMPPKPDQATVGYRAMQRTAEGKLRLDLIDHVFQFGTDGDRPLVGDFNGDGVTTIAVYRNGAFFLDLDGNGRWSPDDVLAEFGQIGDLPVVGDWTGDGVAKLGVFRNGMWILDTNNNRTIDAADRVFTLGEAGDLPATGDFDGDGITDVAVYRAAQATPPAATSK